MDGKKEMKCDDGFFCTKKLDKDPVMKTVLRKK